MSGAREVAEAIDVIGLSGLRWLLALDADPLGDADEILAGMSSGQRSAFGALLELIRVADSLAGPGRRGISALASQQLVGHPSVATVPPALTLRQASGGLLPAPPETDDALAATAGRMAVQLLGAYLVDPALHFEGFGSPFLASIRFDDPLVSEWCAQVLADPELGQLFGGPHHGWTPDNTEAQAFWWDVTGRGGSTQLALLPSVLCDPVAIRLWSEGRFDPQSFIDGVVEAVGHMRRLLVAQRRVPVPTVIGIAGLRLPPEASIMIDEHACFRAVTQVERQLLSRVGGDGVETVLATTFDYRLRPEQHDASPWLREYGTAAFAALDEVAVRARAAAVLATRHLEVGSAAVVATLIHSPLSFAPAILSYLGRPPAAVHQVTNEQCLAIEQRARAMAALSVDRIDVAIRRLLGALERPTATDGFIDAVIGWDNLFGSREGDSTLRISVSFAYLLGGDDLALRQTLRSEIKAAYSKRSDVVHGATTQLPPHEAFELRHRAVELLADAVDQLLLERPDLLLCDGADRSNRLIIGDGRGPTGQATQRG